MMKTTTTILVVLAAIAVLAGTPVATATEAIIEEEPSCVTFSLNPPGAWVDPGCIPPILPPPGDP